jgi:coenzyme F420-0:L-glutamate ligase/coenzyme F420-1:gamma-L-glutamate ligase
MVTLTALKDLPLVQEGDDIAALVVNGIQTSDVSPVDGLIVVIAQKIISKAEGRAVRLASVVPGHDAEVLARKTGKDARLVELILAESVEVIRQSGERIITENKLGIIMANAGIDQSNIDDGYALLLPEDPDASAANIGREGSESLGVNIAVVIADSTGRPWRKGVVGLAIGIYGVPAVQDVRGSVDLYGRELQATEIAIADSIAAAATLLMGQGSEGNPVVLVSGLSFDETTQTASDVLRAKVSDLFR